MDSKGEIIIYQNEKNGISLNVRLEDENVWLTQANLADLYQSSKSNVSEHIKHIFEEGELDEHSVVRKFRTTASDGKYRKYQVKTISPVEQAYLETMKQLINKNDK
jgi:hypothetical protein